jgi:hypothetical protein
MVMIFNGQTTSPAEISEDVFASQVHGDLFTGPPDYRLGSYIHYAGHWHSRMSGAGLIEYRVRGQLNRPLESVIITGTVTL